MRKLFLKLTARLIASVAIFAWGMGMSPYNVGCYAQSTAIDGIPQGSYIFSVQNVSDVETLHMADVYYSTATQSNVNAKYLRDNDLNLAYYYVPAGEAPVSFMVLPNIKYGFESAENLQTGATYSVNPQHVIIKASDLAVDQECRVKLNLIENVRKGRLTVLVDNPADIIVQNRGNGLLNNVTSADFTKSGDKYVCTVNYSPESEKIWNIALKSGKRIFKTTLDGVAQTRSNIFVYDTSSSATLMPGYILNLTSDTHTVDITTQYPDIDFPVTFKMVQDGGNETDQSKLDEKITYVRIDGVTLDRSVWEGGKTFTVSNGSQLSYALVSQVRSQFEVKDRICNGISFGTSNSIILESETPGSYDFKIKALINNPVRLKVRSSETGFDKFDMDVSNYYYVMQKAEEDFILDYRNTDYNIRFYPHEGYIVSKVTLTAPDGKTQVYNADASGEVRLKYSGMNAVYDVEVAPYERNIPLSVYIDGGSSSGISVTLGVNHVNREYMDLKNGRQTVNVNPMDFPIHVHESGAKVYVNGVQVPEQGNHDFITEAPAAGSDVRIFSRASSTYPVTIKESPAGVNATITMDGNPITYGSYFALPGTEFVITPTTATGMILQTSPYSWIEPKDGKFTFSPNAACELTIRPKAVATITCDAWNSFELHSVQTGEVYKLQGKTTDIVLPYVSGSSANTWYEFKIVDPNEVMRIASASGTNYSINDANDLLELKSGGTVTLVAEKNPKPYFINIHVVPDNFYTKLDPATGKYGDMGNANESCTDLYVTRNEDEGNNGEYGPMPTFNKYLRYGDNNYYRDYSLHDINDENSYNGNPPKYFPGISNKLNEFFNLTADQFPVTIHNGSDYQSMYIIKENNSIEEIYSGGEYTIERPSDGNYKVDLRVSLRYEQSAPIVFHGADYYYQLSGHEEVLVREEYYGMEDQVYSFSTIKIRPIEGGEIEEVSLGIQNSSQPMQFSVVDPDENGNYIIAIDPQPFGSIYNLNYAIRVVIKTTLLTTEVSDNDAGVKINGVMGGMDGSGGTYYIVNLDDVKVTCEPNYTITSIVDLTSGKSLDFNPATGLVYGLTDGMNLYITVEKYERNNTLTLKYYRNGLSPSATGNATLILAPATMQKKEETAYSLASTGNGLLSRTIYFNPSDAPFALENATYKLGATTVQDKVYLNNVEVPFVNGAYQFPGEVPDGSTLILLRPNTNAVSDVKATAEIESGLKVDVTVGGLSAPDLSGFTVPVATAVKVTELEGNEFDYKAEYSLDGGATWNVLPTAGYTLQSSDRQLMIRATKTYNTLIVNIAEGTDLSDLKFSNGDVEYELTDGNTLMLPTRVKSLMITTSKPDSYIEATVGDGVEGMEFNKELGTLSGIVPGTLEISTKTIDRNHEVMVFLDDANFDEGTLVRGYGKVIETSVALSEGFQNILFSKEELPLVYRLIASTEDDESDFIGDTSFDPNRPETMPSVFINGEQLEYSPEHGGYVFPEATLTAEGASVIKIYAPKTGAEGDENPDDPTAPQTGVSKISVFYLVENGVKFEAIEDYTTKVTEAGMRDLLPSTLIELTAESESGDDVFVEVDGVRVEPVDGKYTIMTGNADVTIAVKLVKLQVTLNAKEWQNVHVTGNGFSYPMYDETSILEFPQSTESIVLRNEKEGTIITAVKDAADNDCDFNPTTGELKVSDKMNVTIVMGDYTRDVELMIYVEEGDEQQITHLVLAEGTTVEKAITLQPGYQIVHIHQSDLPLAVTTTSGSNAEVYLGAEEIMYTDGVYEFPDKLEAKSVVKIYTDKQTPISLTYDINLTGYDFTVWHDRQKDVEVSTDQEHSVLPGTEISFVITPTSELTVLSQVSKASKVESEDDEETADGPVVTVNDEMLTPDADGVYTVKVTKDHADGLSIKAVTNDPSSGVDEIVVDKTEVDVYNVNGVLILKGATKDEIAKLPAGVYIAGGQKITVR